MTLRHRLRASSLGAVLIFAVATPSYAATGDLPDLGANVTVTHLASGGLAIVRPAQGAPVAAVELWFRAPSVGFGPTPTPSLSRLAAQVVAASKPLVGKSLGKTVADLGGKLSITAYSDSVDVSAVVPASDAAMIVRAMTTAYFAPVATPEGLEAAAHDVAQEALISSFDVETVVRDDVFGSLFTSGPQHFPPLGDPKNVSTIGFDQVREFASRAFRADNATLVVSGSVDASVVASAVAGRSGETRTKSEPPAAGVFAAAPAPVTAPFVQPSGGYGWVGPAIADQREATAMDFIADYLFRPDSGYVSSRAARAYPESVVIGQFVTLHDPGVLFVAYSGKDAAPLKAMVDDGLAAMRKPLDAKAFAGARDAFEYHLLSDLQTPVAKADNLGWYSVEGAVAYAPGVRGVSGPYFDAARSLTPDFVASVAAKYLGKTPAVVTLTAAANAGDK